MINLIWAMDENNLIGSNNALPWHYKEDLQYFKKQTLNHDCLMGYNTYLSIVNRLGHPLLNRRNFVLYNQNISNDVITITNLVEFLKKYQNNDEILFVIGGKSVYEQCLNYADYLYITRIHKKYDGDTYFENLDLTKYSMINKTDVNELSFEIYKRN